MSLAFSCEPGSPHDPGLLLEHIVTSVGTEVIVGSQLPRIALLQLLLPSSKSDIRPQFPCAVVINGAT